MSDKPVTADIEAIRARWAGTTYPQQLPLNDGWAMYKDAQRDFRTLLSALDAATAERVCDAFEHKRKLDEAWEFCGGVVKERDALRDFVRVTLTPNPPLTDEQRKQADALAAADGPIEQPFTDERRRRLRELTLPLSPCGQMVIRPSTVLRLINEVDTLKARGEELEGRLGDAVRAWKQPSVWLLHTIWLDEGSNDPDDGPVDLTQPPLYTSDEAREELKKFIAAMRLAGFTLVNGGNE